jgi:hypothetical protein
MYLAEASLNSGLDGGRIVPFRMCFLDGITTENQYGVKSVLSE